MRRILPVRIRVTLVTFQNQTHAIQPFPTHRHREQAHTLGLFAAWREPFVPDFCLTLVTFQPVPDQPIAQSSRVAEHMPGDSDAFRPRDIVRPVIDEQRVFGGQPEPV